MFDGLRCVLLGYAEKDGRGYPDWAMRYVPIVERLGARVRGGGRILEIGANENGLSRFARVRVIAADASLEHLKAARTSQDVIPVVCDMAALPFGNRCFSVCVCVDTFEHASGATRDLAAAEIVRVIRRDGAAVISVPAGAGALRAEAAIREAYRRYTGSTIKWLEEHLAQGLPDPAALAGRFTELTQDSHRVVQTKNGSLWVWRWMWRVLMCGWPGRGNAIFQAVLRGITPVLCRIHIGPCYRTVIWVEPKDAR